MVPKRARVWRAGKDFYLPARHSDGELACDQQMLNAVSKYLSLQEAEKAVAQIRQQREEELKRSVVEEKDETGGKRARVKRGGEDFWLPVRASDTELLPIYSSSAIIT